MLLYTVYLCYGFMAVRLFRSLSLHDDCTSHALLQRATRSLRVGPTHITQHLMYDRPNWRVQLVDERPHPRVGVAHNALTFEWVGLKPREDPPTLGKS